MRHLIQNIVYFFRRLFGYNKKVKEKYIPINNIKEWTEFEQNILVLINNYREQSGKLPVTPEQNGWFQAEKRVQDKIKEYSETGKISHNYIGIPVMALKDLGFYNISEILGYGYSSAESIVNAWKNSSGHNKVLLGDYTKVGIAQAKNEAGRNFFCGLFFN